MIAKSTAAGVALAGAKFGKGDVKNAKRALNQYEQMLRGLNARATGTVGKQYDAQGRAIAQSLHEVRDWMVQIGVTGR